MPNSKVPQQMGQYVNPSMVQNYKTIVCKYWEQGKCKYGQIVVLLMEPQRKDLG